MYAKLTHTCAYEGVRNVSFSENFAYMLNEWPLYLKHVLLWYRLQYLTFISRALFMHVHKKLQGLNCLTVTEKAKVWNVPWLIFLIYLLYFYFFRFSMNRKYFLKIFSCRWAIGSKKLTSKNVLCLRPLALIFERDSVYKLPTRSTVTLDKGCNKLNLEVIW